MFLKRLKNDKVLLCGNMNDLLTLKGNKCNLRGYTVKLGTFLHGIPVAKGVVNLPAKIELL
jgi:hypothetical protein